MNDFAQLTFIQFLVALFMGLASLCLFIWALLSGIVTDVEAAKYAAYRAEVDDDDNG
ncbi:MAG: hypothetical protein ACRET4_08055 [Steroidobacteraceae bacterium]